MQRNRTIDQTIREWARQTPDAAAIFATGQAPMSYAGLAAQVDHVRETLGHAGIGRCDRVATVVSNGPECAALFVGLTGSAGAVPLNPTLTADDFAQLLTDAGAKAVIIDSDVNTPATTAAEELGLAMIALSGTTFRAFSRPKIIA